MDGIGMKVWYRRPGHNVCSGTVVSRKDGWNVILEDAAEGWPQMKVTVPDADVYEDKFDLLGANYRFYRARVEGYKERLKDAESLIRFCYGHDMKEDDEAQAAAREVFRELYGGELDPEAAAEEAEIQAMMESEDE